MVFPILRKKMNVKSFSVVPIINFVLLLFLIGYTFFSYFNNKKEKIVYVDNLTLFNDFNMTRDLKQINGKVIEEQKKKMDSLYAIYQIYKQNNRLELLKPLEKELRKEDQNLTNLNNRLANEVSEQVWARLNNYVTEYGKLKGYKIIFGTQGNGNVMYAEDDMDATSKVISYANEHYEGGKQ